MTRVCFDSNPRGSPVAHVCAEKSGEVVGGAGQHDAVRREGEGERGGSTSVLPSTRGVGALLAGCSPTVSCQGNITATGEGQHRHNSFCESINQKLILSKDIARRWSTTFRPSTIEKQRATCYHAVSICVSQQRVVTRR